MESMAECRVSIHKNSFQSWKHVADPGAPNNPLSDDTDFFCGPSGWVPARQRQKAEHTSTVTTWAPTPQLEDTLNDNVMGARIMGLTKLLYDMTRLGSMEKAAMLSDPAIRDWQVVASTHVMDVA